MDQHGGTAAFWREQLRLWPGMELTDCLKAAHQSVFGPGHFVWDNAWGCLLRELESLRGQGEDRGLEPLDGPYYRFHLRHLEALGLSPQTLGHIFAQSAARPNLGVGELERKLSVLLELAEAGELPWTAEETRSAIAAWRQADYPACHHSEALRQRCHPAYRVIHWDYVWMLPLLTAIDGLLARQGGGVVALEGGSASGKTTLARRLAHLYDCQVFHMDDFFLRPEQRTEQRLREPGGNVDRERFLEEVLRPVRRGETVRLRRYDCCSRKLQPAVEKPPMALTIVEGAYSMHPDLAPYYDLSAFLSVDPKVQRSRIEMRNSREQQVQFFDTWIPLEQRYFQAMDPQGRCDLILEVTPCKW